MSRTLLPGPVWRMIHLVRQLAFGPQNTRDTLRFFFRSNLRKAEDLFKVTIHPRTRLTLGRGFSVEGSGRLHVGHDAGHFPRGTASSLRVADGAVLRLHGKQLWLSGHQINIDRNAILEMAGGYLNHDAKIDCKIRISIGDGTIIAEDVTIMDTDSHTLEGSAPPAGIVIGRNVWIGARCTILKGASIGDGCVIGAGSVVNHPLPAGALCAGVPARVLRENVRWTA